MAAGDGLRGSEDPQPYAAAMRTFDARINVYEAWAPLYEGIYELTKLMHQSGLDQRLLQLVQLRASQLNGCAYCLDLHAKMAVKAGEEERRLHTLAGWRDADWFTDAEKSALALTEEVTVLRPGGPPEEVVDCARKHFGDDGLAKLLLAIVTINAWNRVNVTAGVRIGAAPPPVPSPGP
jgi:AhpD family alkylhydroperoxidase